MPRGNSLPSPTAPATTVAGVATEHVDSVEPVAPRPSRERVVLDVTAAGLVTVKDDKILPVESHAPAEAVQPPAVTRTFHEIIERVVTFRQVGAQSADVTLQPDRATEISLHLSMTNGQVEVVARVERGNFDGLQQHWGGLREQLSQQGVRVSELGNGQSLTGNLTGQSHRQAQRAPASLDELPLTGATTEPLKGQLPMPTRAQRRGWEMWA